MKMLRPFTRRRGEFKKVPNGTSWKHYNVCVSVYGLVNKLGFCEVGLVN